MTFLRFDKRCKLYRAAVTLLSLFVIFSFRKGRFENLEIVPFVQKFSLTDICSLTNEKLPSLKLMIMTMMIMTLVIVTKTPSFLSLINVANFREQLSHFPSTTLLIMGMIDYKKFSSTLHM